MILLLQVDVGEQLTSEVREGVPLLLLVQVPLNLATFGVDSLGLFTGRVI